MTNLNTAFDVAEKYLDIPKMLDAEGEQFFSILCKKCIVNKQWKTWTGVISTEITAGFTCVITVLN